MTAFSPSCARWDGRSGIASIRRLSGGYVADVWVVGYPDGTRVVGKTVTCAPAGLFRAEAEGLAALRAIGHVDTPEVLAATGQLLLLEALAARDDSEGSWEAFAHDLAALHRSTVHETFGWARDGYLGRVVQQNPWTANGHEFFAQHRVLRYLDEPLVQQELTRADRRALERFCDRLTEIIPVMPAVLTHGDLWSGNLLSRRRPHRRHRSRRLLHLGRGRPVHAVGLPAPPGLGALLRRLPGTQPVPARLGRAHAVASRARAAERHGPHGRRRWRRAAPAPYPRSLLSPG